MAMSILWAVFACFLAIGTTANQPYRTGYHFQPPKNWMNDPNGPMYYKGIYHLFYQYNPYGAIMANITWGHSISYDLVNWVHLERALDPSEPYDAGACYSGSVTILPSGKPVIFYTGADTQNFQTQNLAVPKDPSDRLLRQWIKSPHNPVIPGLDPDIDPSNFRDPTTAWQGPDGIWRVLVGAAIDGRGMALVYESKDFVKWARSEKPLHSSIKTGTWECVDFYPVNNHGKKGAGHYLKTEDTKFVLKASFLNHDHYVLGTFKPESNEFSVVGHDFMEGNFDLRYDYGGKFYASKSFFDDAKKRRILWAWLQEACGREEDVQKGWSGLQSIPREVWLSPDGKQVVQWPIQEIESLRLDKVEISEREQNCGSVVEVEGITAAQADVEVTFELPNLEEAEQMEPDWVDAQLLCDQKNVSASGKVGPFGLLALASKNLTEQTAIFFRVFKNGSKFVVLMCADLSSSSLRPEVAKTKFGAFVDIDPLKEKISLRTLIDHSVIESFGGEGKTCITSRVYPKHAIDKEAKLYAFNYGSLSTKISKLNAWSMKQASMVPHTDRRKPPAKQ